MTGARGFYFQNARPSAEELPQDLALIVTSCWKEDPNTRPDFTQIIHMLLHYLSMISPAEHAIPPRIFTSENAVFPPESPGTSSLMAKRDDNNCDTPKTPMENKPRGFFFCFNQCYWTFLLKVNFWGESHSAGTAKRSVESELRFSCAGDDELRVLTVVSSDWSARSCRLWSLGCCDVL